MQMGNGAVVVLRKLYNYQDYFGQFFVVVSISVVVSIPVLWFALAFV